jgi:hypothetical protein
VARGEEGHRQVAREARAGQLQLIRDGSRGGTWVPSFAGKLGMAGALLEMRCFEDVLRLTFGSSEIPFSEKMFEKHFEFFKNMDFGGRNAFEQIEYTSRASAKKPVETFASILSVHCVNMGGRVRDRLDIGDPFRCYFDSNSPQILVILETQTIYRNKIPDLPGYTTIFKKAIKKSPKTRGRGSGGIALFHRTELTPNIIIKKTRGKNILWMGFKGVVEPSHNSSGAIERTWFCFVYISYLENDQHHAEYLNKISKDRRTFARLDRKNGFSSKFCIVGDFNTRLGARDFPQNSRGADP